MNLSFASNPVHADTRLAQGEFVEYGYLGEPLNGLPNLTLRTKPPIKPQPEDEQGVGRAPAQAWAATDHPIHDNPDWYSHQPEMFDQYGSNSSLQTAIPIASLLALEYYQNHEAQSSPGETQPTTVLGAAAVPYSQLAVLG